MIASSSLLEAALSYARRGWPVFPCSPRNKRPLLRKDVDAEGKAIRGTGGVTKATCDEEQIRAWWRKWPNAMIGVSVGRARMLVIDFDPRIDVTPEVIDPETGEVLQPEVRREWTLDELKAAVEEQIGCALPISLAARTPSGGVHVYLQMPEGVAIGNKGSLPQHVDVRGLGGYTIVPPSVCEGDGKNAAGPYRWLRGDEDAPIAAMPKQLEDVLRAPANKQAAAPAPRQSWSPPDHFPVDVDEAHRRYAMTALDNEARELAQTPKGGGRHGGRNKGAYEAGYAMGRLIGAGAIAESMVRGVLTDVVRAFDPGAYQAHCDAIDNGIQRGIERPRDLSDVGLRARPRPPAGQGARAYGARSTDDAGDRPFAPSDAFHDDGGDPAPHGGDEETFQSGTGPSASGSRGGVGRINPDRNGELDRACACLPTTDLGNAERFMARHGWRFRFCPELGWFIWDDRRWELLSEEKDKVPGAVSLAVYDTVRSIRHEADLIQATGLKDELDEDDPERENRLDFIVRWKGSGDNREPVTFADTLRAHAVSSEGSSRIGCIAPLVKSFNAVAIRADAMDADRMAINVLNGTLRLTREGKRWTSVEGRLTEITIGDRWGVRLDAHDPNDLISKVAAVTFDPAADCDAYDAFLSTVQPDEPMRRFLHQWGGLSLTGDIGEQKLVFHHGGGRNGKSTLNDLWGHIAGDYGATIAIETFLDQGRGRKGGEATPDLARLPGVRFLRTSEPEKGAKLAEALIKLITGGEPIDARHLNKGFFTFLPSFKLSVQGNHKPKITGHDDGIWRRVMLVPWAVQIARVDVDAQLPAKLRAEASGVLNRLMAGLLDWRTHGLVEPAAVTEATAKYREQSDQLGRFLADCTQAKAGARSKSSELFALFAAWSKANGAAEWQQVGFTKAMEDRGFENKRSNGMQWLDIEMTKGVDDFATGSARSDDERPPPWPEDDYIP